MANLTGSTTAVFFVRLSAAVDEIVDVDWSTRDGTAIAGEDYEAASGTVSFLPGETEKTIDVIVYGQDDVSADGKKFYIELKPPANAVLSDALAECVITVEDQGGVLVTSLVIAQGKRGFKGNPGLSAYEQAVLMGYTGTVEQWMAEIGDASQAAQRASDYANNAAADALIASIGADAATLSGKVFPTAAAGVDPSTGVAVGHYFNVRSSSNNAYIDEYQNVGGVATPTGKSYPSASAIDAVASTVSGISTSISFDWLYAAKSFSNGYKNYATSAFNGYIAKATGAFVSNILWWSTDFISVTTTTRIVRDGAIVGDTSQGCSLACYDANKAFLGYYIDTAAMFNVKPTDLFPLTKFVRLGYQSSSNAKIYAYEPSTTAFVDEYVLPYIGKSANVSGAMTVGYLAKTDGNLVYLAGWGATDFIAVDATSIVTRDGDPVATSSAVAPIACYDVNKVFLGYVQNIDRTEKLKIGRTFPNVKFIRASFVSGSTYNLYVQTQSTVSINEKVKAIDPLNADFFTSPDVVKGYVTLTGEFTASDTWLTTPLVPCKLGQEFTYTGRGNVSLVAGVSLYDKSGRFLESVYANTPLTTIKITIANTNAKFIRASAATAYAYSLTGIELPNNLKKQYSTIVPSEVYALKNQPIFLYADGIVGNADNYAWNISEANERVCKILPTTSATIPVKLQTTEDLNNKRVLAEFNVLVTDTPVNPAAKRYIISLGDSLTDGTANSGITGAYVNELSRRLNGVGRQILAAELSPAPLAMTNLEFIGTRGNEVVKHEGRGGWRASHYLNNESVSSLTNAFWNPATSQFDLGYYLSNNGFSGVNATGSNLTIIILLGWNDVYNSTAKQAATDLGLLIDKIRSTHSNTDIICLGLNQAPVTNFKLFAGSRYVSKREVFEAIKLFNDEYKAMIATKTNVDFLQISCSFNSEIGYRTVSRPISGRSIVTIEGAEDHVHPNEVGYAMISDAVCYKLLYKYCR